MKTFIRILVFLTLISISNYWTRVTILPIKIPNKLSILLKRFRFVALKFGFFMTTEFYGSKQVANYVREIGDFPPTDQKPNRPFS